MSTPVTNFAKGQVALLYTSAATSIDLLAGHGSRFPSTFPYPVVWWNATDYPNPADDPDVEIVTVTGRTADTLTVARGAEGTTITNKNVAGKTYVIIESITKAMWEAVNAPSLSQSFRGLSLQTHYDADQAANKVVLMHADAIVMSDGTEVLDWNLVEGAMTTSGIGGLDTGSEQASTWYSIHAAYNGATKALLLHREKAYTLDQDFSTTANSHHGLRAASATTKLGQGFKLTNAGPLPMADVSLVKVGTLSASSQYWFTIESNNGGVPSGTVLATSQKYDASRVSTIATWQRVVFPSPATLSAATQYHLVLQGNFAINASNYLGWRADTVGSTYANGSKAAYDGATWTLDTDDDFMIKLYITINETVLVAPAGYTTAKIGYCFNNGSSDLRPFRQHDHTIQGGFISDWSFIVASASSSALVDLRSYLPPVACMLEVFQNQTIAAGTVSLGPLEAMDIGQAINGTIAGSVCNTAALGDRTTLPTLGLDDHQGMMLDVNAGTAGLYVHTITW